MWHSLVARFVRDEEAAGSNPVIPTMFRFFELACCWLFLLFAKKKKLCYTVMYRDDEEEK